MILEQRGDLEDDEEENLSEHEDHISINSESDYEFEEEDEIDRQPALQEPVSSQQQDKPASSQWQQRTSYKKI